MNVVAELTEASLDCAPEYIHDAVTIIEEKGLKQVSDVESIEGLVDQVMADNQDKVEEYRGGKDKLFGFFVGQVMKQSGGQANPGMVNQILKSKLDS